MDSGIYKTSNFYNDVRVLKVSNTYMIGTAYQYNLKLAVQDVGKWKQLRG